MYKRWSEDSENGFYEGLIIPGCQPTRVAVERTLAALEAIPRQPRFSAL